MDKLAEALPSVSVMSHRDRLLEFGLPGKDDPVWPALGGLFSRPWFFRLWTSQEIVLATTGIVYCGKATVGWPKLEAIDYAVHQQGCGAVLSLKKLASRNPADSCLQKTLQ